MNIGQGRTKIWLALPVLALMLAAIAMSGLQHGTAYAAELQVHLTRKLKCRYLRRRRCGQLICEASGTDMSLGTADGGAEARCRTADQLSRSTYLRGGEAG